MSMSSAESSFFKAGEKMLKWIGHKMRMNTAEVFEHTEHFIQPERTEKSRLNTLRADDYVKTMC